MEPWRVEGDDDERNERARKAYQALLTVTARTPDTDEYREFSREVKSLAQSKYNFTFGNNSVSTFVAAFYDAVLLYALALKESLPEKPGEVNLDGSNLTKRMWGKSFKGKHLTRWQQPHSLLSPLLDRNVIYVVLLSSSCFFFFNTP